MTKRKKMKAIIPIVVTLFGILIGCFILFYPSNKETTSNVSNVQECAGTNSLKCYMDYYENRAKNEVPKKVADEVRSLSESDIYVKSQCHQIMHAIGHGAFERYGYLSAAFKNGDNFCWSGYYHGIIESAVGALGPDKIREAAATICADLAESNKYSFDHYNCVHGLGHGFMTVDNFKLFDALDSCNLLNDTWEQNSCYGGVFMENVMVAVREDGTSEYLRPDELMYPCTAVDTQFKEQCYLMQTSYALQQSNNDFKAVATMCNEIPDSAFIATCFQSLGRDASGNTNSDLQKTKMNCAVIEDQNNLKNCVFGAARDITSYYHDDTDAKKFCALFESSLAAACLQEVTTYYASFTPRKG